MKTVLLTDGLQRKTLTAARSLGKRGLRVITAEKTRVTPTAFSRFNNRTLVYPDPVMKPEAFYQWLIGNIRTYHVDVLIPMDDCTMDIVMRNSRELEKICGLLLPPSGSYQLAGDKGSSALLAADCGICCPKTILPEKLDNLEELAGELGYPLIIKPRKSSGSRGIRLVKSQEELKTTYCTIHENYPWPVLQEYIPPGRRYDVCLLFDKNCCLKASFVQQELRHFPLEMGPSTVQESVWYPELVQQVLPMMEKLQWKGIVELEFMLDKRDGKLKFMEINPRFWNSLHMSVLAGIDFPWLMYRLISGEELSVMFEYRTGIRCRWLLPGDIFHFVYNKSRWKMDPPFLGGKKYNLRDDILSMEDPFPALGFILACIRYLFDMKMWRWMLQR